MSTGESKNFEILESIEKSSGSSQLVPMAKAFFVGAEDGDKSNAMTEQNRVSSVFTDAGAINPTYDPNVLTLLFENSSVLRQCVDAYVTNIDSFGHRYVPLIDLDSPSADEKIADALCAEQEFALRDPETIKDADKLAAAIKEPSAEDIKARKDQLRTQMRAERARLENFFENVTCEIPFAGPEGLRGLTRQDIEVLGAGYWEILRNGLREIVQFNRLEGRSIRLMPIDDVPIQVTIKQRVSALKHVDATVYKRFRRFVQTRETTEELVYFKEFGDPRLVDANTGRFFASEAEAEKFFADEGKGRKFRPATEILQFKITSTRSPYGVPRWIGALLAVMGTRQAEEINFLYFENRSVPPLAILVTGGRLNTNTVKNLTDFIENQIKGKRNFHKMLVIEAEGPSSDPGSANNGRMKIQIERLTDAQQKEGLFMDYAQRNAETVGQTFRLPKILRGDSRDQNRSTAEAAVDFAEIQVFGPIRQQFDWLMNKVVLPSIGIVYHHFRSNGPTIRDPEQLCKMIVDMVTGNILTPGEGRELAIGVFNREFEAIKADWTTMPVGISIAGHNQAMHDGENGGGSPGVGGGVMSTPGAGKTQAALGVDQSKSREEAITKALADINRKLSEIERGEFREMKKEIVKTDEEAETIRVPYDVLLNWVTPEKKA